MEKGSSQQTAAKRTQGRNRAFTKRVFLVCCISLERECRSYLPTTRCFSLAAAQAVARWLMEWLTLSSLLPTQCRRTTSRHKAPKLSVWGEYQRTMQIGDLRKMIKIYFFDRNHLSSGPVYHIAHYFRCNLHGLISQIFKSELAECVEEENLHHLPIGVNHCPASTKLNRAHQSGKMNKKVDPFEKKIKHIPTCVSDECDQKPITHNKSFPCDHHHPRRQTTVITSEFISITGAFEINHRFTPKRGRNANAQTHSSLTFITSPISRALADRLWLICRQTH